MTEDRRAWKFEQGMQPEYRQALALEFIAYYLDRTSPSRRRCGKEPSEFGRDC